MPVVRSRDVDGVDVLLLQQFAEVRVEADTGRVAVGLAFRVQLLKGRFGADAARLLDVAKGDDFAVGHRHEVLGFEDAPVAAADDADGDAVARRRATAAQHGGRHNQGCSERSGQRSQEAAAACGRGAWM